MLRNPGRCTEMTAFVAVLALLAGCAAERPVTGPATTVPEDIPEDVEAVGERAWLYTAGTERSLFLIGTDGVIVTDPLNPAAARRYRAAIRALTNLPVRYVAYSHNHRDRIGGAAVFKAEGAQVVAHERCADFLAQNPHPDVTMPDITFTTGRDLEVGGATLSLRHFGPAHGDCLTVFHARPAGLVQVVDLVAAASASFPDDPLVPNLRPHNLRQFFAAVEAYAAEAGVTGVVASSTLDPACAAATGCAEPGPATGAADLIAQQGAFWNLAFDTVTAAHERHAIGNDSMPRLRPEDTEPFRRFDGYDPDALLFILRRIVAYEAMGR